MKSKRLKYNYLRASGLTRDDVIGYQAHHIIPSLLVSEKEDLSNSGVDEYYDGAWNCLLLPERSEFAMWNHLGTHPRYTGFVRRLISQSIQDNGLDFRTAATHAASVIRIFYNENETALVQGGAGGQSINTIEELVAFIESSVLHQ